MGIKTYVPGLLLPLEGGMQDGGQPTIQPGESVAPGYYSGGEAAKPGSGSQTWTSAGSYTWTVPSGVTRILAAVTGGGGGGGDMPANASNGNTLNPTSHTFTAIAGEIFLIALAGGSDSTTTSATATISGTTLTEVTAYNTGSSDASCLIVWSWKAPASGSVTVDFSSITGLTYYQALVASFGSATIGSVSNTTVTSGSYTASPAQSVAIVVGVYPGDTPTFTNDVTGVATNNGTTGMGIAVANANADVTVGNLGSSAAVSFIELGTAVYSTTAGGGGGAMVFSSMLDVTPGSSISGTVGSGGTSGVSPVDGGSSTLTVAGGTLTAPGGSAASASSPGSGGAVSSGTSSILGTLDGSAGSEVAGGGSNSLLHPLVPSGAGATASASAGVGGGGFNRYAGGNGQVTIFW